MKISLCLYTMIVAAFAQNNPSHHSPTADLLPQYHYVLQFNGVLPCADCPGIETELTLVNDDLTYTLTQTYLDRDGQPFVSTGTWTTLRGFKDDENGVVYWLDPESNRESYYLKTSESTIVMLDKNQEMIMSDLNFTLTKTLKNH